MTTVPMSDLRRGCMKSSVIEQLVRLYRRDRMPQTLRPCFVVPVGANQHDCMRET
ncbi:hypothetical protein D3C72_2313240 [compost metagenome]